MILKIVVIILLIAIIAGKPQGPPKGWPKGKPWPTGQHNPCICNPGPSTKPGGCFDNKPKPKPKPAPPKPKPKPKPKPPPKKGGKRGKWGGWDPPVPKVRCRARRTPRVFLGHPDPDWPVAYPGDGGNYFYFTLIFLKNRL